MQKQVNNVCTSPYLNLREVGIIFKVCPRTVRRWIQYKKLPYVSIQRSILVPKKWVADKILSDMGFKYLTESTGC